MKFFNNNFVKNTKRKKSQKKSRADLIEQRLFKLFLVAFIFMLAFVGIHIALNGINITTKSTHYMTLTQAETGNKEVYGANKDAAGNVTNLNNLVSVSCYGDSFTNAPDDATASYPGVLSILAQRTVYNVAVDNDSIFEMAAREGGKPILVSPFIIPPTKASTEVLVSNEDDKALNFDFSKNGGLNPCTINGIEGLLSEINGKYCFTRTQSGDETLVLTPTEVKTRAMEQRRNDICVFFLGDDAIYKTPDEAVKIYQDMVNYLPSENRRYIVVGPIKGEIATLDAANKALAEAFGDNYLDLRSFLINQADKELKINLSEDDRVLANNKIVPYIYFSNSKYLSAEGADAAGLAIFNKLDSLNYFSDAVE